MATAVEVPEGALTAVADVTTVMLVAVGATGKSAKILSYRQ